MNRKLKYVVLTLLTILLLFGCSTTQSSIETKEKIAESIATQINTKNLKEINLSQVQNYDDFTAKIDKINLVISIVNKHVDKEFDPLSVERTKYDQFTMTVTKYSPLIENYNDLIVVSRNFNVDDEELVDAILTETAAFAFEVAFISSFGLHELIFKSVGEFAVYSGLLRLSNVCRPCVSAAMSSAYWTGKNIVVDKGSKLFEELVAISLKRNQTSH